MPLFTDINPLNDQTRDASHQAGIAIIKAIQEAFYGLGAYEFSATPGPEFSITRLQSAAEMFESAAGLYDKLAQLAPDSQIPVSVELLNAFMLVLRFQSLMDGVLLRESLTNDRRELLIRNPVSRRFLINLARDVSRDH